MFPELYQGNRNDKIPFYKVGDMNTLSNYKYMDYANNYISDDALKILKYKLAPKNTIIFPKVGAAIFTNKRRILSKDSIFDNNVQGLISKNKEILKDIFLYFFMCTIDFRQYIQKGALPSINKNIINKIKISFPNVIEQQKIGLLFDTIDHFIHLQQQLLNNLKKYKKGLLTALFERKIKFKDKNGNDYPNWKEYKFEDFLVESKHLPDKQDLNKRITVKLNLKGVEKRKVTPEEKEGASINYIRKEGQFIYGKQNIHKGAFGIIPKELNNFQSSSDIPSFDFINNIIINNYFYYYLSQEKVYEKLEYKMTGTGSKRLHSNVFLQELIFIPCIEEQKKIIDFLTILDKKIEKQDELLKKIFLYKNGLLQQMFI